MYVVCCARKESRDGADQETSCECVSRTESIAGRTSNQSDQQCGDQSNDV